jgi:hypothetical protein
MVAVALSEHRPTLERMMARQGQTIPFEDDAEVPNAGHSNGVDDPLPFQYFEELDDSLLFDVHKVSDHPEVRGAFKTIWPTLPQPSRKVEERKGALRCILCNLAVSIEKQECIAISRRSNDYRRGQRYGQLFMTYGIMRKMLDALEADGWIVSRIGFFNHDHATKSRCTRFWATAKLGNLLYGMEPDEDVVREYSEVVILRDLAKQPIQYNDTPFTTKLRRDLTQFNELLHQTKVEYEPHFHTLKWHPSTLIPQVTLQPPTTPSPQIPVSTPPTTPPSTTPSTPPYTITDTLSHKALSQSILVAVFNRAKFDCGGRLYSKPTRGVGWQSLSQEERATITIDGEATVELDYSGLHIHMLYAEAGRQYEGDPYAAVDANPDMRPVVKKLFLMTINAQTGGLACKAMNWELTKIRGKSRRDAADRELMSAVDTYQPEWMSLVQRIREAHQPIGDRFCSDAGIGLMNKDAAIIRDVLMHFTEQGIVCLPVHDSVIIAAQHEDELLEAMQEAYGRHMDGFECPVDRK